MARAKNNTSRATAVLSLSAEKMQEELQNLQIEYDDEKDLAQRKILNKNIKIIKKKMNNIVKVVDPTEDMRRMGQAAIRKAQIKLSSYSKNGSRYDSVDNLETLIHKLEEEYAINDAFTLTSIDELLRKYKLPRTLRDKFIDELAIEHASSDMSFDLLIRALKNFRKSNDKTYRNNIKDKKKEKNFNLRNLEREKSSRVNHDIKFLDNLRFKQTENNLFDTDIAYAAVGNQHKLDSKLRREKRIAEKSKRREDSKLVAPAYVELRRHKTQNIVTEGKITDAFKRIKNKDIDIIDDDKVLPEDEIFKKLLSYVNPIGEHAPAMDYFGPWLSFIYKVINIRSYYDVYIYLYDLGRSVGAETRATLCGYSHLLWEAVRDWFNKTPVVTESLSSGMITLKTLLMSAITGDMGSILKNILLCVAGAEILPKEHVGFISQWIGTPLKMKMFQLIEFGYDSLVKLVSMAEAIWLGAPCSEILMRKAPEVEVLKQLIDLNFFADKLYFGVPVEGMMCAREYSRRAKEVVACAEFIIKNSRPTDLVISDIRNRTKSIKEAILALERQMNGRNRFMPLGLVIHGTPGVGKANFLNYNLACWSRCKGRDFHEGHVFHKTPSTPYWEGLEPSSQPFYHYTEMGNTAEKIAATRGDPAPQELPSIMDSLPFLLNMAFEGKGKYYAHPEVVIIDTNNAGMNLELVINNSAAVRRRFVFVEMSVKDEFKREGSDALDVAKSLASDVKYMDRWWFKVYVQLPINARESHSRVLLERGDIYAYTKWAEEYFSNYIAEQSLVMDLNKLVAQPCNYSNRTADDMDLLMQQNFDRHNKLLGKHLVKLDDDSKQEEVEDVIDTESKVELIQNWNYAKSVLNECSNKLSNGVSYIHDTYIRPQAGWEAWYTRFGRVCGAAIYTLLWQCAVWGVLFAPATLIRSFLTMKVSDKRDRWWNRLCVHLGLRDANYYGPPSQYEGAIVGIGILCSALGIYYGAKGTYRLFCPNRATRQAEEINNIVSESPVENRAAEITCMNDAAEETLSQTYGFGQASRIIQGKREDIWNLFHKPQDLIFNHKGSLIDLEKSIKRNVRPIRVVCGGKNATQHGLGLFGNYILINAHALGGHTVGEIYVQPYSSYDGHQFVESTAKKTQLGSSNIIRLDNDLCILVLSGILFHDITTHLTFDVPLRNEYPAQFKGNGIRAELIGACSADDERVGLLQFTNAYAYPYHNHAKGDCGMPLIIEGNGIAVAGIHFGGKGPRGFAAPIKYNQIRAAIDIHESRDVMVPLCSEGHISLGKGVTEAQLEDPVGKSVIFYEDMHGMEYYGKVPGHVLVNNHSKLVRTGLEKDVSDIIRLHIGDFNEKEFGKPMMMPVKVHGKYISPYNIAVSSMGVQKQALNPCILRQVIIEYVCDIIGDLSAAGVECIAPLSVREAINGVVGNPFIKGINKTTAAGFGLKGKKIEYLVWNDQLKLYDASKELLDDVHRIIRDLASGVTSGPVFNGKLKDEARELSKCKEGKTRLFFASPFAFLIVCRMFLLPIYALMVEFGDAFGSAIGINAHVDGTKLMRSFEQFSEFVMEGDYKNFDQKMPFDIGWASRSVVYRIAIELKYTIPSLQVLRCLLTDLLFPYICILMDIFRIPGQQPSGQLGTAEDNSIRGVTMLRYFVKVTLPDERFRSVMIPKTYGDDVLAAVREDFKGIINNVTYATFCEVNYGMIYTSATKDADLTPFMSYNSMSFLKRRFVFDKTMDMWKMPLELSTVVRALAWQMPSPNVSKEDQLSQTFQSMCWELFFHCESKSKYYQVTNSISEVIEKHKHYKVFPVDHSEIHERIWSGVHGDIDYMFRGVDVISTESNLQDRAGVSYLAQSDLVLEKRSFVLHTVEEDKEEVKGPIREYEIILDSLRRVVDDHPLKGTSSETLRRAEYMPPESKMGRDLRDYGKLLSRVESLEETIKLLQRNENKPSHIRTESDVTDSLSKEPLLSELHTRENLVDDFGADRPVEEIGYAQSLDVGQEGTLELDNFLSRPVEILAGSYSNATLFNLVLNVWDLYTKVPAVRAKLRNYAFLRGDLHVQVTFSATPFQAGMVLASYQPWPSMNPNLIQHAACLAVNTTAWRPLYLNYLSQAPGAVYINLNENKPVEMVAPFIHPKPVCRLFNTSNATLATTASYDDFYPMGSLYLQSVVASSAINFGSSASAIGLQIYAWMENVQVSSATGTVIAITTESAVDERKSGPVERAASYAMSVSRKLSNIPIIRPYAMASEMGSSIIRDIAAILGWSRPSIIREPNFVKNEPYRNASNTIGSETVSRIGLDPKQELSIDPRVVGVECDDMVIREIASRESLVHVIPWATSAVPMSSVLYTENVLPHISTVYNYTGHSFCQPSAMGFVAQVFSNWRADIVFHFRVICTPQHRGKFAVFYEPNNPQLSTITSSLSTHKQYLRVFDLQDTTDVEVCVKWSAHRAWLRSPTSSEGVLYELTTSLNNTCSVANGFIFVTPFTPLQSPDGSGVSIAVSVRAENLHVNGHSGGLGPYYRNIITQSEVSDRSASAGNPVSCISLNDSTANDMNISKLHFGEEPFSFRTLLHRYVRNRVVSIASSATAANFILYRGAICPDNGNPYTTNGAANQDLFSYLKYAYMGWRGGIRRRIYPNFCPTMGPLDHAHVVMEGVNTSQVVTVSPSVSLATAGALYTYSEGTVQFVPLTNGGIEAEFPFYSNNLFLFNMDLGNQVYTGATDVMESSNWFNYWVNINTTGTYSAGFIAEDIATGEDFSFLRFQGAPFFSTA